MTWCLLFLLKPTVHVQYVQYIDALNTGLNIQYIEHRSQYIEYRSQCIEHRPQYIEHHSQYIAPHNILNVVLNNIERPSQYIKHRSQYIWNTFLNI